MKVRLGQVECPRCPLLREQLQAARQQNQALQQQVRALQQQVQQLQAQLKLNSRNSSKPPSSDPWKPRNRRRPASGRKPGGQLGHPGHCRKRLPPQRVNHTVDYHPTHCRFCQGALPRQARPGDPSPAWHQVAELPPVAVFVTEHLAHGRTCPDCGKVTYASIPQEIRRQAFGPRLTAAISYFSGRCHDGKRTVQEIFQDVFDLPISLGSVCAREREMQQALARPYAQAQRQVRLAPVKHVDETTWKSGGQGRWLWVAATPRVALYRIHRRRKRQALRMLLGDKQQGTIVTDRHGAYSHWPLTRRQLCWAHLKRDFQRFQEAGQGLGRKGLGICRQLFGCWRDFRQGKLDRPQLRAAVQPLRGKLKGLLMWWRDHGSGKARGFAAHLLEAEPALWNFALLEGVEPTNNHAERMLRPAVLWRKNSFGSNSRDGCQFVERILTVTHSLRLQGRNLLNYLTGCIDARRTGQRPPRLTQQ
jgi:transposase